MITRGVASVRSPVHNLQMFNPEVTNEQFLQSIVSEFRKEYNVESKVVFELCFSSGSMV